MLCGSPIAFRDRPLVFLMTARAQKESLVNNLQKKKSHKRVQIDAEQRKCTNKIIAGTKTFVLNKEKKLIGIIKGSQRTCTAPNAPV